MRGGALAEDGGGLVASPVADRAAEKPVRPTSAWDKIPGGQSLIEWLGRIPRFHDAEVLDIRLTGKATSFVRIHTWIMTDEVDDRGYFVLDRHAIVTVSLDEITYIALTDFHLPGIIFDLEMSCVDDGFQILWSGSYGVAGTIRAKRIRLDFEPGKPPPPQRFKAD